MSAGGYFFFFYYRTIIFSYFGYSSLSMFISLGFKFFVPIMHLKYCIVWFNCSFWLLIKLTAVYKDVALLQEVPQYTFFNYEYVYNLFHIPIFSHPQGEYIKHPVLYELSHKYGFTENLPESCMSIRLEEIKEAIRREIRKELKIKEGAEKLREVAKDRRSLSDVAVLVKKSKSKLAELKSELQELESQILLTSANTAVNSNGQGEHPSIPIEIG